MNIFILDWDLEKCAQYYVNKHLVKMILEHAQMLSTVNRKLGLNEGYKIAHPNHPCTLWVEGIWRGYSYHKSMSIIESLSVPNLARNHAITRPWLAMPDKYKEYDVVQSYRNYYIGDKQHIANWGNRGKPYWFKEEL